MVPKLILSARRRTHLLDEGLKHQSAVRYVAAETRATRIRIARELLCLCEVDTIVAHGEQRTIKVGRSRATYVHHYALWVAIRMMYDVVFVKETQALNASQHGQGCGVHPLSEWLNSRTTQITSSTWRM